ncbi:MAG: class I mannose-6-phosphate isomerase [Pseudobacteriovorax sp.]|nr:class I mannose-6-phosphate isomerase [Pseudobacteriovorax sp.]
MPADVAHAPLEISFDLFTNLSRTPWAGNKISQQIKKHRFAEQTDRMIGESWELSCDPEFPSLILPHGESLQDYIGQDPDKHLGQSYTRRFGMTMNLVVKLLNSRVPLSFQVHPPSNYHRLLVNESSKTESWLILDAEPGSGLYIGFNDIYQADAVSQAIEKKDGSLKDMLQFVPVQVGDYFDIEPGVPHAVGPGTLILEPQFVDKGRGGKTYRLWDWDRKYDENGRVSDVGKSRDVHLKESLELIDLKQCAGEQILSRCRGKSLTTVINGHTIVEYPGNSFYRVYRVELKKSGRLTLKTESTFSFLECVSGEISFETSGKKPMSIGQPFFASACVNEVSFRGTGCVIVIVPDVANCSFL